LSYLEPVELQDVKEVTSEDSCRIYTEAVNITVISLTIHII